jgi:hypothetical protein
VSLQAPPQLPTSPARDPNNGVGAFLAWAATGACLGAGLLTAPTIGLFLFFPAAIAATVLIWRGRVGIATVGTVSGLGLISLAIAYLNRGGPGQVCTTTATSQSCTTEWSPWPWLAAGIMLITAGLALFLALRRSANPGTPR